MSGTALSSLRDAIRSRGPAARSIRKDVIRLGPWAHDVEVAQGVRTSAWREAPPGTYPDSLGPIPAATDIEGLVKAVLGGVYPGGLDGRRVLDCACNCGAHVLWAGEMGAGRCFGIDAREHWIRQARFLARHREWGDRLRFEVRDLYDLPTLDLEPFEVTFFTGILYHLPDPVTGLRIAADLTSELLVISTDAVEGPPDVLVANRESARDLISGVHELAWLPTGPEVLRTMLHWCGFPHTRITRDIAPAATERSTHGDLELMPGSVRRRVDIIAARSEELLAGYDGPLAAP